MNKHLVIRQSNSYEWLPNAVRQHGHGVVDIVDTTLLKIHGAEAYFDGQPLNTFQRIFFISAPSARRPDLRADICEFIEIEWHAALVAVFSVNSSSVVNASWVLNNHSLRYSKKYWLQWCSRYGLPVSKCKIHIPANTKRNTNSESIETTLEVFITRRRIITEIEPIFEISQEPLSYALRRIQLAVVEERLDFLWLRLLLTYDGVVVLLEANIELPGYPVSAQLFRKLLEDIAT